MTNILHTARIEMSMRVAYICFYFFVWHSGKLEIRRPIFFFFFLSIYSNLYESVFIILGNRPCLICGR